MTNIIRYVIEASVPPENLDAYKEVASKLIENIKANEPDTLGFAIYFNDDESVCYLYEEYKDSDAVFAHLQTSSEFVGPMIELCNTTRFEVFGNASDALIEAIEPYGATFIGHWQGMVR